MRKEDLRTSRLSCPANCRQIIHVRQKVHYASCSSKVTPRHVFADVIAITYKNQALQSSLPLVIAFSSSNIIQPQELYIPFPTNHYHLKHHNGLRQASF